MSERLGFHHFKATSRRINPISLSQPVPRIGTKRETDKDIPKKQELLSGLIRPSPSHLRHDLWKKKNLLSLMLQSESVRCSVMSGSLLEAFIKI